MEKILNVELVHITPSKLNPRREYDEELLKALADSIKKVGVLEPLIVRPGNGKADYEIVCGERRFRASQMAGVATAPCVVRELNDDQAFDLMIIENLHREDLDEFDEATGFQNYIARHKDGNAYTELAEQVSKSPGYIRSRVSVLGLPKKALDAWKKGDLTFSHLQQLLRIEDKSALATNIERLLDRWDGAMSVKQLKKEIDNQSQDLSHARFDKAACRTCASNSVVQKQMFDLPGAGARCQKADCFIKKQKTWFMENWSKLKAEKKLQANTFIFEDERTSRDYHHLWSALPKGCVKCENLGTGVRINGEISDQLVCLGEKKCFDAMTNPKVAKDKKGKPKPGAPRVSWHGEHFRDLFYRKHIEATIDKANLDVKTFMALAVCSLVKTNYKAKDAIGSALDAKKGKYANYYDAPDIIKKVIAADLDTLKRLFRESLKAVIMEGQTRSYGNEGNNDFGTANRRQVAEFLGISVEKMYAMDEDYLKKKTTAEIRALWAKFDLGKRLKAKGVKLEKVEKLRKSELVDVILKSGLDLVGLVPEEIRS